MNVSRATKLIAVSQLLLDLENPRLATVPANNHDAIRAMTQVQEDRVLALAQHLLENGPNPSSLPMVIPLEEEDEMYYVLDGNRRLTALKLLESPLLAEGLLTKKNLQRLKQLAEEFEKSPITQLNCAVFRNRDEADLWIQLTHRGLNKGAGMYAWNGQVGARYDARRKGISNFNLQLLNYIKDRPYLSKKAKQIIEDGKFPITTLDRLFGTPYVREKVGVEKDKKTGNLVFVSSQNEIDGFLYKIIEDLATGNTTVSDLKKQTQRIEYINALEVDESHKSVRPINTQEQRARYKGQAPTVIPHQEDDKGAQEEKITSSRNESSKIEDESEKKNSFAVNEQENNEDSSEAKTGIENNNSADSKASVSINQPINQDSSSQSVNQDLSSGDTVGISSPTSPSLSVSSYRESARKPREMLIPRSCKINISQKRVSDIFKELKKLRLEEFPNSGAVMLRVFLELSLDHFLETVLKWENQKIDNTYLTYKLSAACRYMKENDVMTKEQLAPINKTASGDGIFAASVKSLNSYVHNRYYSAIPSELTIVWDDFQIFIESLWSVVG